MSEHDAPWRNEGALREKYIGEQKTIKEIAAEMGCSDKTVSRWMDKFDIEKRDGNDEIYIHGEKWNNEDWLREKYCGEKMSAGEISDLVDCSPSAIHRSLKRNGIERRDRAYHHRLKPPHYQIDNHGYERVKTKVDGKTRAVRIHRLLAISEGELDPSDLKNSSINVHHKNNIPWDNRPENIEVMSKSKHQSIHAREIVADKSNNFGTPPDEVEGDG